MPLKVRENVPVFLKKRDIISLNDIDDYFRQLGKRVSAEATDEQ